MAYAALLSLTHVLQRTIKYDRSYLFPGEEQQIESLLEKVGYFQEFLDNFPRENIESIEGLERKISDAACQTEDIIESCIADRVLEESASHNGEIFTNSFHVIAKLIEEVDSIKTRVEKIEDERGIQEDLERNTSLPVSSLRADSWGQSTLVGLDDGLAEIKDRLFGGSSQLEVVSIVGMGGIGKTTLVYKVYIDKYTEYHFDIHAWLTVSQEYSVREILLGLLDSMKTQINEPSKKDIDQLGALLYKKLKGRRYLFVMDDVWDVEAWDSVKRYFSGDKTGSQILLTTNYINSGSPLHCVRFLNDEESWKLFCHKVFGEDCCPIELEEIGKKIAQNCRGLPLAVVVIGGLLSKATKTPHYWRRCFLYKGIFLEDFEIKVRQLTKLWVAEGILKPTCSKTLEEVGEEYFLDLVQRSLILVQKKGSNGKIRTCRIHDLLWDLCVREAQKEKFFHVIDSFFHVNDGSLLRDLYGMRRVSIHDKKSSLSSSDEVKYCHATKGTLQGDGGKIYSSVAWSHSSSVKIHFYSRPLKVLHMKGPHFRLYRMEELVNIRYIYCYNKYPELSNASIYSLRNLQTIVSFEYCGYIELPPEIWKMPQLRHVKLNGDVHLPDPLSSEMKGEENSIVVLENLQTLSTIHNFSWTKEVLERIPNLQKLAIHYNYNVVDWERYYINNFVRLTKLESLKCCVTSTLPCFLRYFTFPTSLKKLILDGIELYPSELPILGLVPNLEVLKLKSSTFPCGEWKPNEGEFLNLKFLLLHYINLKHWRAESIHFPRLERLIISVCEELDEIPSGFGEISTLQSIKLYSFGDTIVRSAKKIEGEQLSWGNDAFKLYIKKY